MIFIDGVVGVGKSTLGEILADELKVPFYKEPVYDNPLLDKFYHDRKKYSFSLQVFFLNKRFQMVEEAKGTGAIFDRSLYCDIIFAEILNKTGDLIDEELDLYKELTENMFEHLEKPRLTIYLETNVDNAIKKIKERGRDYEQIVPREYWERLNAHYRDYFDSYDGNVLKINVDSLDFRDKKEDKEWVLNLIKGELDKLKR